MSLCKPSLVAQVRFIAKAMPSAIGKDEEFEFRLIIENGQQLQQVSPPSLKDFMVISGPNEESGMESINGHSKQYVAFTYILKPKSKGNFIILPGTAKVDGKILKSNAVSIQVSNHSTGTNSRNSTSFFGNATPFDTPLPGSQPEDIVLKRGENVQEKINKNIFIKVDVNKKACYIGEPIIVTYKLYTRLKSESNIIKNPSFNGFSVIDLIQPGNNFPGFEKVNGKQFNVYTLRKVQLYPLQAGRLELETAEVENNIQFIKEDWTNGQQGYNNMLQDFGLNAVPPEAFQNEKVTLQSKPVLIDVKPLPETGKPASFKGATGNFTIDASIEKDHFTTDEAGRLKITLAGAGNLMLVNAPDIRWPEGVEVFEPKVSEDLNKEVVPISGHKSFEYPLTVSKAGSYIIPPVSFSYFNPRESGYTTISTKQVLLTVTKGNGEPGKQGLGLPLKTGREQFFDTLFGNRLWIIIPVALLILTGLFFWVRKEKSKDGQIATEPTERAGEILPDAPIDIPANPLVLTEEKLVQQDAKGFYLTLNREFRDFLAIQLQLDVETINKKGIAEGIDKKGVPVATGLEMFRLLDDIEWQLYTPFAETDKMQDMYQRANTIIHSLQNNKLV